MVQSTLILKSYYALKQREAANMLNSLPRAFERVELQFAKVKPGLFGVIAALFEYSLRSLVVTQHPQWQQPDQLPQRVLVILHKCKNLTELSLFNAPGDNGGSECGERNYGLMSLEVPTVLLDSSLEVLRVGIPSDTPSSRWMSLLVSSHSLRVLEVAGRGVMRRMEDLVKIAWCVPSMQRLILYPHFTYEVASKALIIHECRRVAHKFAHIFPEHTVRFVR